MNKRNQSVYKFSHLAKYNENISIYIHIARIQKYRLNEHGAVLPGGRAYINLALQICFQIFLKLFNSGSYLRDVDRHQHEFSHFNNVLFLLCFLTDMGKEQLPL